MNRILTACVLVTILGGCCIGPAALPGPTKKAVKASDITGVWQYTADYEKTTITLELKADGTFIQTVKYIAPSEPQMHTGTWSLEGSSPKLRVLKPVFGKPNDPWVLADANWWIVDSYQEGVKFALFGAADDYDPDNCFEFKKLR